MRMTTIFALLALVGCTYLAPANLYPSNDAARIAGTPQIRYDGQNGAEYQVQM